MWVKHSTPHTIDYSESSDGGYLASASDLMIGLLFVFIILVVVLALEQRHQQQTMAVERANLLGAGDPRGAVTTAIGSSIQAALPGIRVESETGVISLPEDVLFDVGSAALSLSGQKALVEASKELSTVLPCYIANRRISINNQCPHNRSGNEIETVFIEGHTDNRPLVRLGYDNTNLSLDRARAVYRALVQSGDLQAYKNKSNQPIFSFSAYADTRPLKDIDPSNAKNRRVDLRIVLTYRPIEELIQGIKLQNMDLEK